MSSFCGHCPNLMSTKQYLFSVGLSVISKGFPSRFLKCYFWFWSLSSWLATGGFKHELLFPTTNFLYGLPCWLRLFIFYKISDFKLYWSHCSDHRRGEKISVTKCHVFVAASHQTRLDTRSKARRPIKVGIKGRGRSGTSRDSNPACLCCSSAHLVQCEPDEASSFTNPNVGPGTYASLRLKLDAWSSAVQGGQRRQKCSSPTRR